MKGSSRASSNRKAQSRNLAQKHRKSQGALATSPEYKGGIDGNVDEAQAKPVSASAGVTAEPVDIALGPVFNG